MDSGLSPRRPSTSTKKTTPKPPPEGGGSEHILWPLAGHVLELAGQTGEPGRQGEDVQASALAAMNFNISVTVEGGFPHAAIGAVLFQLQLLVAEPDVGTAAGFHEKAGPFFRLVSAELRRKARGKGEKPEEVEGCGVVAVPADGAVVADGDIVAGGEDDGAVFGGGGRRSGRSGVEHDGLLYLFVRL